MELQRVSEIEDMVAAGELNAYQTFTQMKQLVYREPPCYAMCEKTAYEREIAKLKGLIKEASDYLDTNKYTSIGNGSILHQKFKQNS